MLKGFQVFNDAQVMGLAQQLVQSAITLALH